MTPNGVASHSVDLLPAAGALKTAAWAEAVVPSALQHMLRAASGPDIVSFALGLPATEALPAAQCREAFQSVLEAGPGVLQYSPPSQTLKRLIVDLMSRRGVICNEQQVFVTTGAQQALSLITRLFAREDAPILVEELLYPGFRQVVETCGARFLTVPCSPSEGMDIGAVRSILRSGVRPALLFVVGQAHNPLGASMSLANKRELAELASRYGTPIVEDDAYGLLNYDGPPAPALRSINEDVVFYAGSLSKIFAPALRVGWIVAPEWAIPKLSILKEATDLDSCALSHRIAEWLLSSMDLNDHLDTLRALYRERRNTMIEALRAGCGGLAQWESPDGGFFLWVRMRKGLETSKLLKRAIAEQRVAFVPGAAFAVANEGLYRHCMRLNFSACPPGRIEDGIARLSGLITAGIS